jgi:RNA polymerase sigma-70 factor (ECF subfamily)
LRGGRWSRTLFAARNPTLAFDPQGRWSASRLSIMPPAPTTFAELYPAVAPALHAWAVMRLGSSERGRIAPEDLTQDVWLRAVQVFAKFDAERMEFRPWLFAVAKHVLLEVRRRLRHAPLEPTQLGGSTRVHALEQVPEDVTSVSRRLAKDEDLRRFVARLQQLEPVELQTVLHCGIEGMPQAEAATRLGEPAATTAKRWQRLRERMRSWATPLGLLVDQ